MKTEKDKPISVIIDRILKKKIKDRTNKEHLLIIKEMYKGSVRDYLLSMGKFKDVKI